MSYILTEEHESIRKTARKFAMKEIAPVAIIYDEKDEFPWEIIRKLHRAGCWFRCC